MITMWEANLAWFGFWSSYWLFGVVFTYLKSNIVVKAKVVNVIVRNMFLTWLCVNVIYWLPFKFGIEYHPVAKLLICMIMAETWFHHSHLMLHQDRMYKLFHRQHHEFKETYALTGMYCSGYEAVLCNFLSATWGPLFIDLKGLGLLVWVVLAGLNVTLAHSGWENRWIKGGHDIHHLYPKFNFGILKIFDFLYGTLR